ncbi:hypothetical protein C8R45DRAFT_1096419 [Mycena sanguinolenta]|nr:hypothetical protein C8R45DRAFT_1096419 [Mycena sanguinolenta]
MASTKSLLERSCQRISCQSQENRTPLNTPSSTPAPQTVLPLGGGNTGLDSPNPFSGSLSYSGFPSPLHLSLPSATLKSFGERTLKRVKLSSESEAEFKRYIETASKDERDALHFVHILQVKDILAKSVEERSENWTPSNKLAKNIRKFDHALLLLPNIQHYSGMVESAVVKAMRASNIKELPVAESFECDQLASVVSRELALARSAMKKTIQNSMDPKNTEIRAIAALASKLLKHAPQVKATLALYYRLALIRSHIPLNHSNNEFWDKVDQQLEELHSESPEDYVGALETLYEEDCELYKSSDKTTFKTGNHVGDGSPQWLQNLSKLAPSIQRVTKKKQGTKQKRGTEPEDDEEVNEEPGGASEQPDDDQEDGNRGSVE